MPFSLLELQAEAATKFNINSEDTMQITQDLRDKHGCITYNRSDCRYLDDSHYADAGKIIAGLALESEFETITKNADLTIKSRAFNSKKTTAHHGIIPDKPVALSKLTIQERQVYELIVLVYLAQFYPAKETERKTISLECNGLSFGGSVSNVLTFGWESIFKESDDSEIENDEIVDCVLEGLEGASGLCSSASVEAKETKPPKAYSEGTLLKDLKQVSKYCDDDVKAILLERDKDKSADEKGGIGTPATRHTMLSKLEANEWCTRSDKLIWESTKAGRDYIAMLAPEVTKPDLTALWYEDQIDILNGTKTVEEFMVTISNFIRDEVERIKRDGIELDIERHDCTETDCDGFMRRLKGKDGHFWTCSNYDGGNGCKNTMQDRNGKPSSRAKRSSGRSSGRSSSRSKRRG